MYEEYKLLPKGRRKKDFNIMHGRYGAGTCKRKPRYSREVNLWADQTKRHNYLAGRKQRKDLKGLTRAGRLAYFKTLREKWTKAEREAWKEDWKRKSAPWKKKRGVVEEPKEPPRKKIRARKSQHLPVEDDVGVQLIHR